MNARFVLSILFVVSLFIVPSESRASDPYKILGIEKNASQREIQKAFHRMSLQYHPDKNKKKGAQEKFAEINNAYEILSDEEKRKNYDIYGDEKGDPKFDTGGAGGQGGYTHFTSGGHGNHRFRFRPDDWTYKDRHQQSESFSFSFGGPNGGRSSGHGLDDIFSNIFMGWPNEGSHFDGFGNSVNSEPRSQSSSKRIKPVTPLIFEKEVADQGMTWLLLAWMHKFKQNQYYESVVEDVARSMDGALKAGSVNCESEQSLCQTLGIYLTRSPRIFVYTNRGDGGSLVEYTGDLAVKSLKAFCQGHMPRFSKRVDLGQLDFSSASLGGLPRVMLLSTKKDTPTIWRVLSGLYRKRIIFYDTLVRDVSDPAVTRFGIAALPAIIGWLPEEEVQVLKAGIPVKDLKSGVQELSTLLEGFERRTRKAKRRETESGERTIPLLTKSNLDHLCGQTTPVCIIGVFRSSRSRENLESVLLKVSRKSLSRQQNQSRVPTSRDSISYVLLDAGKQTSFLSAFDRFGYKSRDKFLVAYKPRKGKFATYMGEVAMEEVEKFVGSVLNGDVRFDKTLQKPLLR